MRYIVCFYISLFFLCGCAVKPDEVICFRNICLRAEIAQTTAQRKTGLMLRQSLPAKEGMLLIFPEEARHGIWMKNMLFPLDIIWVSEDKKVVYIVRSALPCLRGCNAITPEQKTKYALEVNAGFVDKYRIKIGDKVSFRK